MAAAEEADRFGGYNLTVHEYHNSRVSSNTALSQGYDIVKALLSVGEAWKNGKTGTVKKNTPSGNSFTLRKSPPVLASQEQDAIHIKEWGAPATEEEIFNLDTLEEFHGTDLQHLLLGETVVALLSHVEASKKRREIEVPVTNIPPKRMKLNADSLYRVIPQSQPHMHPSPFLASEIPVRGNPFKKAEPLFISAGVSPSPADDARVAWLIPIRGVLPWDTCTSAALLDPLDGPAMPSASPSGSKASILWTQESLLKFWVFLLDLRTSSSLGSLAISFHTSKRNQYATVSADTSLKPSHTPAAQVPRSGLSTVDYIKIYHDAPRRFHLRSALDIWAYQANEESQKIRLLKGARLVLVDEVSQGILIL